MLSATEAPRPSPFLLLLLAAVVLQVASTWHVNVSQACENKRKAASKLTPSVSYEKAKLSGISRYVDELVTCFRARSLALV
jgi:hypothetical protein